MLLRLLTILGVSNCLRVEHFKYILKLTLFANREGRKLSKYQEAAVQDKSVVSQHSPINTIIKLMY